VTPRIGVTLGDPAGVGAEVILKALAIPAVARAVRPLVIGDLDTLRETAARLKLPCRFVPTSEAALELEEDGTKRSAGRGSAAARRRLPARAVPVLATGTLGTRARRPGRPTIEGGRASYRYVETATRLALRGAVAGIVTAPINKAWVSRAGFPISGHTELLRELTGAREVRMMFAAPRLKVALVTTHVALAAVPRALTLRDIARTILLTDEHLRRYHRLARPRLAVAGLNPHAGEQGLFGKEEATLIAPAVKRARKAGADATGPYPADSLFFRAVSGEFDAVIAMYHDQGLVPLKLLHFHDAVNVTLGLPIVRTSPDHGTAYDIAGRGVADAGSMAAALVLAGRMARESVSSGRRAGVGSAASTRGVG